MITLIAALDLSGGIGRDGGIPWKAPDDMKRFSTVTKGHPVVMGRKTWDSLPARFCPLPNRTNIVVTRSDNAFEGALRAASLEEAFALAAQAEGSDETFVIGGAELYAQALPLAERLLLTIVHARHDCDVRFPDDLGRDWSAVREARMPASEKSPMLDFLRLEPRHSVEAAAQHLDTFALVRSTQYLITFAQLNII